MTVIDDVAAKVLVDARRKLPRMYKRDPYLHAFGEVPGDPDSLSSYEYIESVEYRLIAFAESLIRDYFPHHTEASSAWCLAVLASEPELTMNDEVPSGGNAGSVEGGFAPRLAWYLRMQVVEKIAEDLKTYATQIGFDLDLEFPEPDQDEPAIRNNP